MPYAEPILQICPLGLELRQLATRHASPRKSVEKEEDGCITTEAVVARFLLRSSFFDRTEMEVEDERKRE